MSEKKQEKTRKPTVGHQNATLSGGHKATTPDVQASEHLSVQELQLSTPQTPSTLAIHESMRTKWRRRTIYLYPDVDRAVRHHIAETDEEISEVVNAALRKFFGLPEA